MTTRLTIGAAAKESGLPVRTIRFYESEGVVPPPRRSAAGYRLYSPEDLRRLRLIRHGRLLGLGLAEIRTLVAQAFEADCSAFVPQLADLIAERRRDVLRRIDELSALHVELGDLEQHVRHAECASDAGRRVADCVFCPSDDHERRDRDDHSA